MRKSPPGDRNSYASSFNSALSSALVAFSMRDVAGKCLPDPDLDSSYIVDDHIPEDSSITITTLTK